MKGLLQKGNARLLYNRYKTTLEGMPEVTAGSKVKLYMQNISANSAIVLNS